MSETTPMVEKIARQRARSMSIPTKRYRGNNGRNTTSRRRA